MFEQGESIVKKYIAFALLLVILCGCSISDSCYSFPNQLIPILRIELLHNMNYQGIGIDESNMVLLRTLEDAEVSEFMNAVYELPTKEMGTPPSTGYGEYIAKVIYANGDIEMYGPYNIELIPAGSKAVGIDTHYFSGNSFTALFAQYVDIYALPEPPRD